MAVDAIVRVSFQSHTPANQAANMALVGHVQNAIATGPFERVGTAAYSCSNAPEAAVAQALANLGNAILNFAGRLDFFSVSVVRRRVNPPADEANGGGNQAAA